MRYDVSVIIPAKAAEGSIGRAVASVQRQAGIAAQTVVCADDDADYLACLRSQGIDCSHIVQCRTARPGSGPAAARNLAASHAEAGLIAPLDADDEFCDGRLARLLGPAARWGAAAGPTIELLDGATQRVGRPAGAPDRLTVADICQLRLPFFPVFRKDLFAQGWPQFAFAEDAIFNAGLACRASEIAFVEEACYLYHLNPASLSSRAGSLETALKAYRDILAYLASAPWPEPSRRTVINAINEDIANAKAALAGGGLSWRDALRPAAHGGG